MNKYLFWARFYGLFSESCNLKLIDASKLAHTVNNSNEVCFNKTYKNIPDPTVYSYDIGTKVEGIKDTMDY